MAGLVLRRTKLQLVRRMITRSANVGGEAFDAVTEQEFAQHVANQTFVLHWQAHGLRYGIPHKQLSCLARGDDALVNLCAVFSKRPTSSFSK